MIPSPHRAFRHCVLQASSYMPFPSSHSSPSSFTPFPQRGALAELGATEATELAAATELRAEEDAAAGEEKGENTHWHPVQA
jgi:hypothetical protein